MGFVGSSGSGKTTLLTSLIPVLIGQGLRVSTIKHAHHGFDMDRPGKDSDLHRRAGATEVLVASPERWALLHEVRGPEPGLQTLLSRLAPCDLVLVEGFGQYTAPKIEVFRPAHGTALRQVDDATVIAVASDVPLALDVPCLDLNDIGAIAQFVRARAVPVA